MLALVKLAHLAQRYPKQLSGGQQQRVALARALAVKPSILLLDEPFAALDKNLRLDMQIEIKRIQRLSGTTTLIVTHDQEEALSMADRVAVFNQGRLEQFGTAERGLRPCRNRCSSTPSSAPPTCCRASSCGRTAARRHGARSTLGGEIATRAPSEPLAVGDAVTVCVRPEHLRICDDGRGIAGTVEMGLPLGAIDRARDPHRRRAAPSRSPSRASAGTRAAQRRHRGPRRASLAPKPSPSSAAPSSQPQPPGVQP